MANLSDFKIDWNSVQEVTEFKPLEAGTYAAKISKSEFTTTKNKDTMLKLTFDVLGERGGNKKLFENYMFTHKKPDVVKFAQGKLKALGIALGIDFDELQDTSELHGIPVGVKVKVTQSEQYGEGNAVTSFCEYEEEFLTDDGENESVEVETVVDEPEMVEDDVPELVEDEEVSKPTPEAIKAMKKFEVINLIKDLDLKIEIKGKKLGEVKEMVIDNLFGAEEVEDEEDIIIDD